MSLGSFALGTMFATSWDYTDLGKKRLADTLYGIWNGLSLAEAAMGAVMLISLYFVFRSLVGNTTGFLHMDGTLSRDDEPALRRRGVIALAAGALTVLFEPLELYLRQFTQRVEANPEYTEGYVTIQPYGGMWFLSLVLSLLFFVMTLYFVWGVREGSEHRFKL